MPSDRPPRLPATLREATEADRATPGWWRTADEDKATPQVADLIRRRQRALGTAGRDATSPWDQGAHVPGTLRTQHAEPGR